MPKFLTDTCKKKCFYCFTFNSLYNVEFCYFRGLGIDRIFINFLKIYSDPGSLVLVLNTSSTEEVI